MCKSTRLHEPSDGDAGGGGFASDALAATLLARLPRRDDALRVGLDFDFSDSRSGVWVVWSFCDSSDATVVASFFFLAIYSGHNVQFKTQAPAAFRREYRPKSKFAGGPEILCRIRPQRDEQMLSERKRLS
ncbi:MAG: hypothetical protein ACK4JD_03580 [Thermoflexales bacterium]